MTEILLCRKEEHLKVNVSKEEEKRYVLVVAVGNRQGWLRCLPLEQAYWNNPVKTALP